MHTTNKPERSLPAARPISADKLRAQLGRGRILVLAGRPIDGDSLASAIAIRRIIQKLGHDADLACGDPVPEQLSFLPDVALVSQQPNLLSYRTIMVLDCGELRLTGYTDAIIKIITHPDIATVVNIDHHLQQHPYGHHCVIDHRAASTGMIVYQLARQWGVAIDQPIATALLTTLYYDTGSFQHSNVHADVMRMAADCVRHGADAGNIAHKLYRTKSVSALRLWGRALGRVRYYPETRMVASALTTSDLQQIGVDREAASGIVGTLAHVPECRFALLLSEDKDGTVKGSMRSDEDKNTDVARIAAVFGGGGHRLASGFRLPGRIVFEGDQFKVSA